LTLDDLEVSSFKVTSIANVLKTVQYDDGIIIEFIGNHHGLAIGTVTFDPG